MELCVGEGAEIKGAKERIVKGSDATTVGVQGKFC